MSMLFWSQFDTLEINGGGRQHQRNYGLYFVKPNNKLIDVSLSFIYFILLFLYVRKKSQAVCSCFFNIFLATRKEKLIPQDASCDD